MVKQLQLLLQRYLGRSLASATALTLVIQLQLSGTGYRRLVLHSVLQQARARCFASCSAAAFSASPAAALALAGCAPFGFVRQNWKRKRIRCIRITKIYYTTFIYFYYKRTNSTRSSTASVTGHHCNSSPVSQQPRYGSTISTPLRHTRLCNPTVRVQLR